MERFKGSIRNLAHIFLDSIGWDNYFTAITNSLVTTPLDRVLQAQGVPLHYDIPKGYVFSVTRPAADTLQLRLVIDGGATAKCPDVLPPGIASITFLTDSAYGTGTYTKRCPFIRDLWVQIKFQSFIDGGTVQSATTHRDRAYSAKPLYSIWNNAGTVSQPIFFELEDKPTGFVFSLLKKEYYQYFVHNEKVMHTPSLVGLKRILHGVGIPMGKYPLPRPTDPTKRQKQFLKTINPAMNTEVDSSSANTSKYGYAKTPSGFPPITVTDSAVRATPVLSDLTRHAFAYDDTATGSEPVSLQYFWVDMRLLNVRRGDWHRTNHPVSMDIIDYTIQGADKNMVMFDPADDRLGDVTIVTINRDNVGGDNTDPASTFATKTTPIDWSSVGGQWSFYEGEGASPPYDDKTVDDVPKPATALSFTIETSTNVFNDSAQPDPRVPGKLSPDPDRSYIKPGDLDLVHLDANDNTIQRPIITSLSGILGSGLLHRDRYIVTEPLYGPIPIFDPDRQSITSLSERAIRGAEWTKIELNLPVKPTPEQEAFVHYYLEMHCNSKIEYSAP
jgi:hypothetical protein